MSTSAHSSAPATIHYPDSDGKPMADNTLQFQWVVTIKEGLDALFRDRPDVFVAGDLLWYPVEGNPKLCQAPDALVVFGRPKGYRGSYKQWQEGGIAPQVVFEVHSPNNRAEEMTRKALFYRRHGVEEYYLYNPENGALSGWLREGDELLEIPEPRGWTSPRLGVRFEVEGTDLRLIRPDGRCFRSYPELVEDWEREEARAEQERTRAEQERLRAEQEHARAEQEHARAERLAERLRAMGIDPESL
ncbi:Uma2 family endonuclease [Tautonia sp. JC769]|uniref:Uma2 family endonuclease n=1 Tax=Tautonia sp. JC769 TaxID=3232135 RepID=UPI00345AAC15